MVAWPSNTVRAGAVAWPRRFSTKGRRRGRLVRKVIGPKKLVADAASMRPASVVEDPTATLPAKAVTKDHPVGKESVLKLSADDPVFVSVRLLVTAEFSAVLP